jgi:hypothetical protein
MTPKVHIKIEQIARLRVAGSLSDDRIAVLLGLTRAGLSRILALPEYQEAEQAVLTCTVSKMDEALAGKANVIRQTYAVGVPVAMKALLETVMQKKDLRSRLEAAKEILDRDPDRTYTKDHVELAPGISMPAEMLQVITEEADGVAREISKGAEPVMAVPAQAKEVVQ